MPGEFEEAAAEGLQGRKQREEGHRGNLGPSCPALGHREEFGFSFKGNRKFF